MTARLAILKERKAVSSVGNKHSHTKLAVPLLAAMLLGCHALTVLLPATQAQRMLYSGLVLLASDCLVAAALVYAARVTRSEKAASQRSWLLFAIVTCLKTVCDLSWAALYLTPPATALASGAGAVYALAFPCLFAAVFLLPAERPGLVVHLKSLIDSAILMAVAGLLWWVFLLGPATMAAGATPSTLLVTMAYPIADLGLAWALFGALARGFAPAERIPALFLLCGVMAAVVVDLVMGYQLAGGSYNAGELLDVGYNLAGILFGLGAWMRIHESAVRDAGDTTLRRIVDVPAALSYLPSLGAGLAFAVLILTHDRTPLLGDTGLALGAGLLTGLLLVRQTLANYEHARLTAAIQASETRYRDIVESQTDLVVRWRPGGHYTYINEACARYFAKTPAQLMSGHFTDRMTGAERDRLQSILDKVTPEAPAFEVQMPLNRPGQATRYVQWHSLVFFEGECVAEIQSVGRDVTERVLAQQDLEAMRQDLERRVSERTAALATANQRLQAEIAERKQVEENLVKIGSRLEHLLTATPAVIFSCRPVPPYELTYVSANVRNVLGREAAEYINGALLWARFVHPEDREILMTLGTGQADGEPAIFDGRFRHQDGSYRWLHWELRTVTDTHDTPVEIVGYAIDVTAQKEAEALQSANKRLTELDHMKSQFVSNVSHELRTPLANIKLYLSLLEHGKPGKAEQYMATLKRETGLLQALIEDLLQLSRLDLNRVRPELAPTDLNTLVRSLVDDRTSLVLGRGLAMEAHVDENLPLIQADARMLTQVLTNLMTNATHYTPAGGRITVATARRCKEGRDGVTLSVCDTGLGISEKDRERLFERFYRGEAAQQTRTAGTGLGLAICQEIVQRHGGEIAVQSEPGRGSTFTVWLPVDGL